MEGPYVITESRIPLHMKEDEKIKSIIIDERLKSSNDFKNEFLDTWRDYYRMFCSYRSKDPADHPWRSNIFVPYTFALHESAIPNLRLATFTPDPFFYLKSKATNPDGHSILQDRADQVEKHIASQFNQMGIGRKGVGTRELLSLSWIFGTAFVKPRWLSNNRPDYVLYNVFDAYWNPHATNPKDLGWINYYNLVDINALLALQDERMAQDIDKIKQDRSSGAYDYRRQLYDSVGKTATFSYGEPQQPMIDVFEYLSDDSIIWVAGSNHTVIRKEANPHRRQDGSPFIPTIVFRYLPEANEIMGISLIKHLQSLQMELNDQRNQKMDAAALVGNPMFRVDPGAVDVDLTNLVARPGGYVPAAKDEVEPFEWPQMSGLLQITEAQLREDMQLLTGETFRELVPHAKDTATASIAAQKQTNARREDPLLSFQDSMKYWVEMTLDFNRLFLPAGTSGFMVRPTDGGIYNTYNITRDDLNIPVEVYMADAPSTNPIKEVGRQKYLQAMQYLMAMGQLYPVFGMPSATPMGLPDLNKPYVDFGDLSRKVFDNLDIPGIDDTIYTGERAAQKWIELIQQGYAPTQQMGLTPGAVPGMQGIPMPPAWVTEMGLRNEGSGMPEIGQPYNRNTESIKP